MQFQDRHWLSKAHSWNWPGAKDQRLGKVLVLPLYTFDTNFPKPKLNVFCIKHLFMNIWVREDRLKEKITQSRYSLTSTIKIFLKNPSFLFSEGILPVCSSKITSASVFSSKYGNKPNWKHYKQARGSVSYCMSLLSPQPPGCCYLWLSWSLQGRMHRLGVAIGKRLWSGRHWWFQYSACLLRLGFRGAVVSFPKSIFHLHQRIRRHNSVLVGKSRDAKESLKVEGP